MVAAARDTPPIMSEALMMVGERPGIVFGVPFAAMRQNLAVLLASPDGPTMAKGSIRYAPTPGWVAGWSRGFALQLGGQVERETSSQGTTVRLILPWRVDSVSTGCELLRLASEL